MYEAPTSSILLSAKRQVLSAVHPVAWGMPLHSLPRCMESRLGHCGMAAHRESTPLDVIEFAETNKQKNKSSRIHVRVHTHCQDTTIQKHFCQVRACRKRWRQHLETAVLQVVVCKATSDACVSPHTVSGPLPIPASLTSKPETLYTHERQHVGKGAGPKYANIVARHVHTSQKLAVREEVNDCGRSTAAQAAS